MAPPVNPAQPSEPSAPKPEQVGSGDCTTTSTDATATCGKLAQIETTHGGYNEHNASGASGRYQFMPKTGKYVMVKAGLASNSSEASALWNECSRSTSAKCKSIQDKMCNWYSTDIKKQLKRRGIPLNMANMYFAWNQGVGGMSIINRAAENNAEVTDTTMRKRMREQAWNTTNTTYDGKEFIRRMNHWVEHKKGVKVDQIA